MTKSSLKILLGHNYYQQAGGEDIIYQSEVALLKSASHRVVEYTSTNHDLKKTNAFHAAFNTIWSKPSQKELYEILKKEKPDIAHFHNTFLLMSPAVYYSCKEFHIPVIQTIHNYRLLCPTATLFREGNVCNQCVGKMFPWPAIQHGCYRNSRPQSGVVAAMLGFHKLVNTWENKVDVFIALTEFARNKLIEGGLASEKIVIKPNFISPDPGIGDTRRENYILYVGRLTPEKGVFTLLHAWRSLKKIKNTKLLIVGDGVLKDAVESFIKQQNLQNIELLGWQQREEVLRLLQTAQFLIFPSEWYEGLPTIILEAFACGLPVISSNLGAMSTTIEHEVNGLHFPAGNVDVLASSIDWGISNLDKMNKMGRNARIEFERKYTREQNLKLLLSIYENAKNQ